MMRKVMGALESLTLKGVLERTGVGPTAKYRVRLAKLKAVARVRGCLAEEVGGSGTWVLS